MNENLLIKNEITDENIQFILNRLETYPIEIKSILQITSPDFLEGKPGKKNWSCVEILAHIRSCSDVWGDTIETMIRLNDSLIAYQSPRSWKYLDEYCVTPFWESFSKYDHQRKSLSDLFRRLSQEEWENHCTIKGRKHTIYSQARRVVLHEYEHIKQFKEFIDISK
jgi:hypothetical protein